jgi:predicted acylesterase/phospholipase RssA
MGIRNGKPVKVLSLDGGGTWSLIQARVLMDLYPGCSGHEILRDFDFVAANSGGGVVTACLIDDMKPEAILDLFMSRDLRVHLFQPLPFYRKWLRVFGLKIGPQFATAGKLACLTKVLQGQAADALGKVSVLNRKGAPVRFLFAAYDYDRDRAVFFRSDADSPAANFPRKPVALSVIDAVHASSTAPVQFFDQPADFGSKRYWDGGVSGLNNPVLAGVVEAVAAGAPRDQIGVLSIGTGSTFLPRSGPAAVAELVQQDADIGLVPGIKKLAGAVLADPPDTDSFLAHLMLGGQLPRSPAEFRAPTALVRLSPLVRPEVGPGEWVLPKGFSADDFARLASMDLAVIEDADAELVLRFCESWMAGDWPNQPIRHGGDLDGGGAPNRDFCEIGQQRYADGKRAWAAPLHAPISPAYA